MPSCLKPLFGSHSSLTEPQCYLLEVDEAKILLDCGCFEEGAQDGRLTDISTLQVNYLNKLQE
jgi:hypothetical protein